MEDPSKTILEVGERLMVSPTGRVPYLRIAHFLRPSINSIRGPNCELPPFSPCSLPSSLKPQDWPLKVTFSCWRYRHKIWMTWVDQMASLYQSTWKKAGIFEAVMNSKYHIQKDQSLVLGITERWCSETKTFVFPWGEATVTLEDVIVLGGYSVLGDSVLSRAESEDPQEIEENLKEARRRIVATKAKKACQSLWIKTFMNSGKELEHHAFLACWLSRYVFAGVHGTISEHVFPVAIQLARGTRIALAPAVLASIYRDLSLLKEKIVVATNSKSCKDQETSKSIVPEKRRLNGSKKSRQSLTKEKQAKDIVIPDHIPPKGSKSLEHSSIGQLQTLSCSSCQELEIPGLALEKRIIRLEKVIAELKAARFGSKFSKKSKKGHSST
ncbi:hypothetical protein SO802_007110 [Lithocarpus litseifolius]|uniref:Aminotransferase-like plant mobile domain-containing protein n=1 Tax=Lithocarpus litseifolius TaxID=425828 RepID=A0AAW2DQB3_9ROSI